MPNYTLEFSEEITPVRPEERHWLEEYLAHLESKADPLCEWSFEKESTGDISFWFHSDEQLPDPLLELLQAFLAHFRPDQYLIIRYALTCDRPLVGEFGGGRVLIAADRVVWSDLDEWERQQIEQFGQSLHKEASRRNKGT